MRTLIILICAFVVLLFIRSPLGTQTGGHAGSQTVLLLNPNDYNRVQSGPTKLNKITELLKNQQEMLKIALGSTKKRTVSAPATKYKDWAKTGAASQSSTFGSYPASNAIDGNADTFSHTDMLPNSNSWLNLKLTQPIEINKIVIENRKDTSGSVSMRKRLPPFTVIVKNQNGVEVASKTFNEIFQTYVWNDVFAVGSQVTIQQLKKNYLHVAEIKVFGVPAHPCDYYEKKIAVNRERVSPIFQQLKISACTKPASALASPELIAAQAAKFDQANKKQIALQKAKTQQATKLWSKITQQQTLERQMAAQAKRLGLAPPKPMYSKDQVALVKKNMDTGAANLTDVQKAECVQLTNKINELSEKIKKAQKTLGATAALEVAKQVSFQIQELQEKYKKLCGMDTSSDLTANTELNMVGPGIEPLEEPEPANS
jgi:hypothetical protein